MSIQTHLAYTFPMNLIKRLISDLSLPGSDIRVALTTDLPDHTILDNFGQIATEVVAGGATGVGYTAGGLSLTNKSVIRTISSTAFDADDVVWSNATITAMAAVIYDNTPAATADKKILAIVDLDGAKSSTAGDFRLTWDTAGAFALSVTV